MTDEQLNLQRMALNVQRRLHDTMAQWQPRYPKLALDTVLAVFDAKAQARSGPGPGAAY